MCDLRTRCSPHALLLALLTLLVLLPHGLSDHQSDMMVDDMTLCTAIMEYSYVDPDSDLLIKRSGIKARYGASSRCESETGRVVHMEDSRGTNHGCQPHASEIPQDNWIALVKRGDCRFDQKIYYATKSHNASAIIVYNNIDEVDLPIMYHLVTGSVAVFIRKSDGETLASVVDQGTAVSLSLTVRNISSWIINHNMDPLGTRQHSQGASDAGTDSRTLLYISLSLVLVLISGLGCLLVYGLCRARQRQRDRANTRVVYAENGDVRGYLVEQRLTNGQPHPLRPPQPPPYPLVAKTNIYTTIIEEEEEEEAEEEEA